MRLLFFIILCMLLEFRSACGQVLISDKVNNTPKELIIEVSQFGQFIKRFNFEEDFHGNQITKSFSDKIGRNEYVHLLFNKFDPRIDPALKSFSSEYNNLKEEFIKSVISKNSKINRISDSLYSVAICSIKYKGKQETLKLLLKQESINKGMAWVICDAAADFFYIGSNCPRSSLFIPPTSNEVNYIHLKSFFNNKDSLACYAYKDYSADRLSIFFQLLHSGEIQYGHVNTIIYFICDIPGWLVQVREFNREGDNSGWLISDVSRINKPINIFMKQFLSRTE